MLRLLMQAGLGFATFNAGQKIAALKRTVVFSAVAALIGLLGLGALVAAAIIALAPRLGPAEAAAAVGGGLVVIAGLVGWLGTRKPRPKAPTPIFERVRAEVGAAAGAVSAARAKASTRAERVAEDVADDFDPRPALPGARRKRAINMVLIATIAGVVLGRRL